ncbi:transposase [Sneathiella glossodoripedis]|uniref:transposase n=1 Tax=Sneathiella glossodoripedis TaxID=418853 RepID=UPI00046E689E|nr:transposase [Sneathiella glossodoripedis]
MKRIQKAQIEITQILAEMENGSDIGELSIKHGISKATLYRWRKKAQQDQSEKANKLKDVALENTRLRNLLTDAALEIQALKEEITELKKL